VQHLRRVGVGGLNPHQNLEGSRACRRNGHEESEVLA
jgi:hypothetical protein